MLGEHTSKRKKRLSMSAPRLGSSTVYTRSLFIILLTSLINVTPCNSYAWDQTDVIDAADGKDPFDFTAEVFFKRDLRRARLSRENNCTPSTDPKNCPAGDQIVLLKELRYQRWSYSVTPRVHFGLWKDLELMIETPIMLYDEQEVRFAGNGGDPTLPQDQSEISGNLPRGQESRNQLKVSVGQGETTATRGGAGTQTRGRAQGLHVQTAAVCPVQGQGLFIFFS